MSSITTKRDSSGEGMAPGNGEMSVRDCKHSRGRVGVFSMEGRDSMFRLLSTASV